MSTHKKRLIYFINPKFQKVVLLYTFLFAASLLLIIYIFQSYYFEHLLEVGKDLNLRAGHPYYKVIQEQKSLFDNYFAGMSVIILLLTLSVSTYFSHKIAGPIHGIKQYFKNSLADKGLPIKVRKKDFFQELPEVINDYFNKKSK